MRGLVEVGILPYRQPPGAFLCLTRGPQTILSLTRRTDLDVDGVRGLVEVGILPDGQPAALQQRPSVPLPGIEETLLASIRDERVLFRAGAGPISTSNLFRN